MHPAIPMMAMRKRLLYLKIFLNVDLYLNEQAIGKYIKSSDVVEDTLSHEKLYIMFDDKEKDDGSYKEVEEEEKDEETKYKEAIDKNTAALYTAVGQLQVTMDALVSKQQDPTWGIDSFSTDFSDVMGSISDNFLSEGSGFVDSGFLLTASQKDENYSGYTELPGLMLEDFHDAHSALQGLNTLLGKDTPDILASMSPAGNDAIEKMYNFASKGISRAGNLKVQSSMMNDKKSPKILDGNKVIVCKLNEKNPFGMKSIAYPNDITRLPKWFKQLPFAEQDMRNSVIDKTVETVFDVLGWDLSLKSCMDNDLSALDGIISFC